MQADAILVHHLHKSARGQDQDVRLWRKDLRDIAGELLGLDETDLGGFRTFLLILEKCQFHEDLVDVLSAYVAAANPEHVGRWDTAWGCDHESRQGGIREGWFDARACVD